MKSKIIKADVTIHRAALKTIFDECDLYDCDETGGRILGAFRTDWRGRLSLVVSGIIEPGPGARRTPTSFFQDGEYQERVFRAVEKGHPEIEHLGNWHTHHVNGHPTLSAGDRETYHRIVNHQNHNTDFFYALLVTARNSSKESLDRYSVRHFLFRRGDPNQYEIQASKVKIVDREIIWPTRETGKSVGKSEDPRVLNDRAFDNDYFSRLQQGMRPFLSKENGTVYWKGRLNLVDGSSTEIVIAETDAGGYGALVKGESARELAGSLDSSRQFATAREAAATVERELNREIFRTNITGEDR